jgi:hypothetical protein
MSLTTRTQVVQVLMEHLQAGVCDTLELLPKTLTLVAEREHAPGDEEEMDDDDAELNPAALLSGREFCTATLDQIAALPVWPTAVIAPLLKAMRDMPMSAAALETLVAAALKHCRRAELQVRGHL